MRFSPCAIIICAAVSIAARAPAADIRFAGTCDGSAAAMLPDGRFASGDDEGSTLRVYAVTGGAAETHPIHERLRLGKDGEPDIEAAARLGDRIYWITSHGRNRKAKDKPERQRFFATSATAELEAVGQARQSLLAALKASPALAGLGLGSFADAAIAPEEGGINIEGLAAGPDGKTLLIGFRSPRARDDGSTAAALLIPLTNPAAIVDSDAAPTFGPPMMLDLDGFGVRDIVQRAAGDYLILAGRTEDAETFALFAWPGPGGAAPRRLDVDLSGLHPEAVVEAAGGTLVLSDDGEVGGCKKAHENAKAFRGRRLP